MHADELKFEVGQTYLATPSWNPDGPRKIAVVIGRCGRRVTIGWVDDLQVCETDGMWDGHEFIQAERPDGVYNLSSAVPINCVTAPRSWRS